jgi:hypothetical protein
MAQTEAAPRPLAWNLTPGQRRHSHHPMQAADERCHLQPPVLNTTTYTIHKIGGSIDGRAESNAKL